MSGYILLLAFVSHTFLHVYLFLYFSQGSLSTAFTHQLDILDDGRYISFCSSLGSRSIDLSASIYPRHLGDVFLKGEWEEDWRYVSRVDTGTRRRSCLDGGKGYVPTGQVRTRGTHKVRIYRGISSDAGKVDSYRGNVKFGRRSGLGSHGVEVLGRRPDSGWAGGGHEREREREEWGVY